MPKYKVRIPIWGVYETEVEAEDEIIALQKGRTEINPFDYELSEFGVDEENYEGFYVKEVKKKEEYKF